jgi:hypothetical protein
MGECGHGLPSSYECRLGIESLEHFLNHRQARHDVVEIDERLEPKA